MSSGFSPKSSTRRAAGAGDAEVAAARVALVLAHALRSVLERVELGVERIDALELEHRAVGHVTRFVELAALEKLLEDPERRRPRAGDDACARFRERFGDCEAEAAVIRDSDDERAASSQVDFQHGGFISDLVRQRKAVTRRSFPAAATRSRGPTGCRAQTEIMRGCRGS